MTYHTLVTFLGRGRSLPNDQIGYQTTKYSFLDDNGELEPDQGEPEDTSFLGLVLVEHINPDRFVILGTEGSQWSVLVERLASTAEYQEAREQLFLAEDDETVTQDMLSKVKGLMSESLKCEVVPIIIPFGKIESEQYKILNYIADENNTPDGQVSLDLTHAYRHFGMIGFLSAFMLERVRNLTVRDLWYGAYDMTPKDGEQKGITPVIKLKGLDRVRRWMSALERFDATGDYGVFVSLLKEDGVVSETAQYLEKAAFHERTHNLSGSVKEIGSFLSALPVSIGGASGLFRQQLSERLDWAELPSGSAQRTKLAYQYLERRDYIRAAMFGWEALITHRCEEKGYPIERYTRKRAEVSKELENEFWDTESEKYAPYLKLRYIRHALTHGTRSESPEVEQMLGSGNEEELQQVLQQAFDALLPQ